MRTKFLRDWFLIIFVGFVESVSIILCFIPAVFVDSVSVIVVLNFVGIIKRRIIYGDKYISDAANAAKIPFCNLFQKTGKMAPVKSAGFPVGTVLFLAFIMEMG